MEGVLVLRDSWRHRAITFADRRGMAQEEAARCRCASGHGRSVQVAEGQGDPGAEAVAGPCNPAEEVARSPEVVGGVDGPCAGEAAA